MALSTVGAMVNAIQCYGGKAEEMLDNLINQLAERKRPVKVFDTPSGNSSLHPPVRIFQNKYS